MSELTYKNWLSVRHLAQYDENFSNMLRGKRVVIVGPSPSLEGSGMGKKIDEFDIVVRINKAFPLEEGQSDDIGSRTDIHSHCLHESENCGGPVRYKEMKEQDVFMIACYPKISPFAGDVNRFQQRNKEWNIPHHIINLEYYKKLNNWLGTRPNSGILTIYDIVAQDVKELYITGFTFFRDGWRKSYKDIQVVLGPNPTEAKINEWRKGQFNGVHIQKPQEDAIRDLYINDDRVQIDDVMKEILEVE